MPRTTHFTRALTTVGALSVAAALALGSTSPAAAAPSGTAALFVGGGGSAVTDGNGGVVVEGPALVQDKHGRDMLDATIRATMAPADGSLPAVDECEPAAATFVVQGERDATMTLTGPGTVCTVRNAFFPTYITVEFDGQHEVVEAKRPQLRGTTGSLSITITPSGFTSLHADSFVPTP
jgi:hypothetical protein